MRPTMGDLMSFQYVALEHQGAPTAGTSIARRALSSTPPRCHFVPTIHGETDFLTRKMDAPARPRRPLHRARAGGGARARACPGRARRLDALELLLDVLAGRRMDWLMPPPTA